MNSTTKAIKVYFLGEHIGSFYGNQFRQAKFADRVRIWFRIKYAQAKRLAVVVAVLVVAMGIGYGYSQMTTPTISFTRTAEAAVAVDSQFAGLSVAELESRLDAIVWKGESRGHSMSVGETYMTFDPPMSWIRNGTVEAKCFRTGGKVNLECYSFGPRQEKIPTVMSYWPLLHEGATISEFDARAVAEGNDSSKQFFVDCAVQIKGCVKNWTSATDSNGNVLPEVQMLVDLIREARGITV